LPFCALSLRAVLPTRATRITSSLRGRSREVVYSLHSLRCEEIAPPSHFLEAESNLGESANTQSLYLRIGNLFCHPSHNLFVCHPHQVGALFEICFLHEFNSRTFPFTTMNFITLGRSRGYVDLAVNKKLSSSDDANSVTTKATTSTTTFPPLKKTVDEVDMDPAKDRRRGRTTLRNMVSWQPSLPMSSAFGKKGTRDILSKVLDDIHLLDDDDEDEVDKSDRSGWSESLVAKGEKRKRLVLKHMGSSIKSI
jgi:hypothetical protein